MVREKRKEREEKKMMGVRKTWDVRNDSGITMRTINKEKREINIERKLTGKGNRATSGEVK